MTRLPSPYYSDDFVTLYHGDSRDLLPLIRADVMVTDPPYGIDHQKMGSNRGTHFESVGASIIGDRTTEARDTALARWNGPAVVFGAPMIDCPAATRQILVWHKDEGGAGIIGNVRGWRRDWEAIYLIGEWPVSRVSDSSVLSFGGNRFDAKSTGHPHAKPLSLMRELISKCPPGTIVDPFAGSGSTLRAAKDLGRTAIGIEIDEQWLDVAARRCAQDSLDFGGAA